MPDFYALRPSVAPWGDYGRILRDGLIKIETIDSGTVRTLHRTGPYVPKMCAPFRAIVVVDDLRAELIGAKFTGFTLNPLLVRKVVRIDWQTWDLTADDPKEYPPSGNPEDYVLTGVHDAHLSMELPKLWVLDAPSTPGLQVAGTDTFYWARHPRDDVAREHTIHWFSGDLVRWLKDRVDNAVAFKLIQPR